MKPGEIARAEQFEVALIRFERNVRRLPGIVAEVCRAALIEQIVESVRRVEYVDVRKGRNISWKRADPSDELFDPLDAAMLAQRRGDLDEACWLIFYFVHFGRNPRGGWRFARDVYGKLGRGRWDWSATASAPSGFRDWLRRHQAEIQRAPAPGGFGNHRKYQSLDADADKGTGAAFETYIGWVDPRRGHQGMIDDALAASGGDPRATFDFMYSSMEAVASFGRMAKLDYLAMLGKMRLAPIEPASAYLQGSTGPLAGARLLFGPGPSTADMNGWLTELGDVLQVNMQVIEDAVCNWQKSPDRFVPFRG